MRGMRSIVAHDYANVDLKIVWEAATIHVAELSVVLEKFFATQSAKTGAAEEQTDKRTKPEGNA
jgi:uncharacterized protein with HEPN domain